MAISVRNDLVEGSGLVTLKGGGSRVTRVSFVDGITVNDPAAFHDTALNAPTLPRPNDPHPSLPQLRCAYKEVKPLGPSQALVFSIYEDRQTGGVPVERLSIRETVTLGQETVQRNPLSGKPLLIYAAVAGGGTGKIQQISYSVPLRNRILYGLFSSPRPPAWTQAVNCVNESSFMGYPKGYWLCTYCDEQWSNIDRKYRFTIGFTTKQTHDWSVWATMREVTGEFVAVSDATFLQAYAEPYRVGMIWHTLGVGRWGLHEVCNFSSIFDAFADLD
jgi:hypothetical protein